MGPPVPIRRLRIGPRPSPTISLASELLNQPIISRGCAVMPKSAFLFPGQGAQTVGMAQQLCATLPRARQLFDEASAILGYDLLDVCAKGPVERLNSTA